MLPATPPRRLPLLPPRRRIAVIIAAAAYFVTDLALPITIAVIVATAIIIARTSIVIVQATSTYARETGIAGPQDKPFKPINTVIATLTALITIAALALILSPTAALLAGAIAGHILIRLYFQPKLKGHTGDTLGDTQQITELAIYIALAATVHFAYLSEHRRGGFKPVHSGASSQRMLRPDDLLPSSPRGRGLG